MTTEALTRCPWVDLTKPDYVKYHDDEWGLPIYDDQKLFECLTLESAQAGLSWYTVLIKRENYRQAFKNFDINKVALFTDEDAHQLLQNEGLIRNKLKIFATINNAKRILEVQKEFGSFSNYLWRFVNNKTIENMIRSPEDYISTSKESDALSKDLKKRGFKFIGSTICYAYMQACGLVNDHTIDCYKRSQISG